MNSGKCAKCGRRVSHSKRDRTWVHTTSYPETPDADDLEATADHDAEPDEETVAELVRQHGVER